MVGLRANILQNMPREFERNLKKYYGYLTGKLLTKERRKRVGKFMSIIIHLIMIHKIDNTSILCGNQSG